MSLSIGIIGLVIRFIAVIKALRLFQYSSNYRVFLLNLIIVPFFIHPIVNLGFSVEKWANLSDSIILFYTGTSILMFVSAHFVGYYIKQFTRTNKDIERRQQVFDQFINSSPVLYFIIVKNRIVYCNPATSIVTGFSREELTDMTFCEIVHPSCKDHIKNLIHTQQADSTTIQKSIRLLPKSGETHWIHATFTSLLYDGELAVAASAQEITRQLASEKALLQAEERLRFAVEATDLVVWDYDPREDKIKIETAPSGFPIKNYPEYFSFNSFMKYVVPEDQERVRTTARAITNKNTRFEIEFRVRTETVAAEWWHMEGRSFAGQDGQVARIIGTSRCIDSQKQAQEALENKEDVIRFQARLLSIIGQTVIAQNARGELVYFNNAARKLFGHFVDEELPIDLNKYIPAQHRIINKPEIMEALKEGKEWRGELEAYLLSEEVIPLYITVSPYTNKEGAFDGFILVGTDLTEYKKIQSALESSEEQLRVRMNQLQIIYNMAEVMKEAENLQEIYRSAANGLFAASNINRLAILNYDSSEKPVFVYSEGLSKSYPSQTLAQYKWFSRNEHHPSIYVSDIQACPESKLLAQFFTPEGIKSIAIFPLVYHNNLLGKLVTFWNEPFKLTSNNKQILARIADQLAIGIIKKKAEIELKDRTNQLQIIADNIPDQLIRYNNKYELLFANKASLDLQALPHLHKKNLQRFFQNKELTALWHNKTDQVIETGELAEFEYEIPADEARPLRHYHAMVIPEKHSLAAPDNHSVLGIIRDTTENRQLQKAIIDMNTRQQRKIGQDLHDELGQLLTGIGFLFAGLRQDLTNKELTAVEDLEKINKLVEQAIAQTRILAEGLNPVTIELHGLTTSLERLAIHTEQLYSISCCFKSNDAFTEISDETSYHLYRIAQEAITNSVKHSQATLIELSLNLSDQKVVLAIKDNGTGFTPFAKKHDGQGLQIMKYRASMLGGNISITSQQQKGTLLICSIPYHLEK